MQPAGGGEPLQFQLSGSLAGLQPLATESGAGGGVATTISFVAPAGGQAPSVSAPVSLEGAPGIAVPVPDIVLEAPFPAGPIGDQQITVSNSAGIGTLAASNDDGNVVLRQPNAQHLTLSGPLFAVERSLQSFTYQGAAASSDQVMITASDYARTSAPFAIAVANASAGSVYDWNGSSFASFADPAQWSGKSGEVASPPGGADIASFGSGNYTATGDGAVGELSLGGTLTLTGNLSAQGLPGDDTALSIDQNGALTLAGGALLSAGGTAAVGIGGNGMLTLMGGALALTGSSGSDTLLIGENAASSGAVFDLEQITAAGSITVGDGGSGTLQLTGVAASASDGGADIGAAPGGSGTAVINGGEWTNFGQLIIGDAGNGSLLIDGAANGITGQVTAFDATLGNQTRSTGTATVAGGDLLVANELAATSTLAVGAGGSGTLSISDDGNVTIDAAQATVRHSTLVADTGRLFVGSGPGGSGMVGIGTGGSLLVDGGAVVGEAGGSGSIAVAANPADVGLLAMTGMLTIGAVGTATLGGPDAPLRASAVSVAAGGLIEGTGTLSGDGAATTR